MHAIHLSSHSAAEYSIYDAEVLQKNADQDSSEDVQAADSKTEQ